METFTHLVTDLCTRHPLMVELGLVFILLYLTGGVRLSLPFRRVQALDTSNAGGGGVEAKGV